MFNISEWVSESTLMISFVLIINRRGWNILEALLSFFIKSCFTLLNFFSYIQFFLGHLVNEYSWRCGFKLKGICIYIYIWDRNMKKRNLFQVLNFLILIFVLTVYWYVNNDKKKNEVTLIHLMIFYFTEPLQHFNVCLFINLFIQKAFL